MMRYLNAIAIDRRRLIDRAKVQKDPVALLRRIKRIRKRQSPPIPQPLFRLKQMIHAGQGRFRRKRNEDRARIACGRFVERRDSAIPAAVQVHPVSAPHLRSRILRKNMFRIHGRAKPRRKRCMILHGNLLNLYKTYRSARRQSNSRPATGQGAVCRAAPPRPTGGTYTARPHRRSHWYASGLRPCGNRGW